MLSQTVFIESATDHIWHALTDSAELSNWLPREAQATTGLGGTVAFRWSDGAEGSAVITAWETERRLQWTENDGSVVDFHLEPRAGCAVVRVVQSAPGPETITDLEHEAMKTEWSYFLHHLKWYLERHRGSTRQLLTWRERTPFPAQTAFARLIGPAGLSTNSILTHVESGDIYGTTTAHGEEISGFIVALNRQTFQLGMTITETANAILFVEVEQESEGATASFWLSTYGLGRVRLAQSRTAFDRVFRAALQLPERPAGPMPQATFTGPESPASSPVESHPHSTGASQLPFHQPLPTSSHLFESEA